jgi:hypothetical protein
VSRNDLWSRGLGLACGLYVTGLLIWCAWSVAAGRVPDAYGEGDGAILELYTQHALHGQWLLGPYSRFGWYHPGPLYIYWLVPFYAASGLHPLGITAGAIAINVVAFGICVWALSRHATATMTLTIVAALAAYLWRVPGVIISAWNPHVLLLPFAALIICGAAVANGRLALLPLTALLASFITQTHVGLAPASLGIAATALIAGLRAHRGDLQTQTNRRWLAIAAVALIVAWGPPLYDQIAGTGNIGQLLRFFAEPSSTPAPREAFAVWSGTLLQPLQRDFRMAWGGSLPPTTRSPLIGAIAIGEVLLLLLAATWLARRDRLVDAWLCRLCAIASLVAFIAIARIRGGLVDHLTFWNTITGTMNVAALAGAALFQPPKRLTSILCTIPLLVVAYSGAATLREQRASLATRAPETSYVGRLYLSTRATIARTRLHRPLIELRGDAWATMAGMLVQLHKHDIPFGVERQSAWLYGAPIAARGDEEGAITITDADHGASHARQPDACLIAWAHGKFVFVRVPTPEQWLKLRCAPFEMALRAYVP